MVVVVLQICPEQAAPQKLTATKKLLPGASLARIKSCRNEQARQCHTWARISARFGLGYKGEQKNTRQSFGTSLIPAPVSVVTRSRSLFSEQDPGLLRAAKEAFERVWGGWGWVPSVAGQVKFAGFWSAQCTLLAATSNVLGFSVGILQ